jgi:hypothetical protein
LSIEIRRPNGRLIERKVDVLVAALAEQLGRPQCTGHGKGRSNPCG